MAYKIILFHYCPGTSIIHKTDPRVKLLTIIFFCIISFFLQFPVLFLLLPAEIILLLKAKIRIRQIIAELSKFFILLLIIFFFRAYSAENTTCFFILIPSMSGFIAGGLIIVRICLVIFLSLLLTSTTTVSQLRDALYFFFSKIPFIPAARFAAMISLTLWSIPHLFEKLQEVDEACKARCIHINKNPFKRTLSFALPLLMHILKQADDIACAMEARCYSEKVKPFFVALKKRDYIIFTLSILSGCIMLSINFLLP